MHSSTRRHRAARLRRAALSLPVAALALLLLLLFAAAEAPAPAEEGGATASASGEAALKPVLRYKMGWVPLPPNNESGVAEQIDTVFWTILYLTTFVFIFTQVGLVWFLVKYRERPGGQKMVYSHGSNQLELIWTAIPAIIVLGLALWGEKYWNMARKAEPENAEHIKIIGKQFNWDIVYAGKDGQFGTDDDITGTPNLLLLPVGKPVVFTITSRDVLHSFFLPDFRLKQDAVPGSEVKVWVTPKRTGSYEIACAEFCGVSHGQMRGLLEVLPAEEYASKLAAMTNVSLDFD